MLQKQPPPSGIPEFEVLASEHLAKRLGKLRELAPDAARAAVESKRLADMSLWERTESFAESA